MTYAAAAASGAIKIWRFLKKIPWQVYVVIGVCLLIWQYGERRYEDGVADERARVIAANIKKERARIAREMEAATEDAETKTVGEQTIAERRKELDNATANIPDQGLTDRQRARVCAELRRQGTPCKRPTGSTGG